MKRRSAQCCQIFFFEKMLQRYAVYYEYIYVDSDFFATSKTFQM